MRSTLIAFMILIGLGGTAILISLGVWQIQRLAWKEGVIADIDARIAARPVPIPDTPDPVADAYLPVSVTGTLGGDSLRVLVSQRDIGAGYRVITALETAQGRILLDRGFVPVQQEVLPTHEGPIDVRGNLQWPQETDSFTPEPDISNNIWFARDVPLMAAVLKTQPVLVVARETSVDDSPISPLPVDTGAIPNDHLQYAITWFSLAAIWLGMSFAFLLRARRAKTRT